VGDGSAFDGPAMRVLESMFTSVLPVKCDAGVLAITEGPFRNEVILYALIFEMCCSFGNSEVLKYAKTREQRTWYKEKRYQTAKSAQVIHNPKRCGSWISSKRDGGERSNLPS
jgi:hypothetical protein